MACFPLITHAHILHIYTNPEATNSISIPSNIATQDEDHSAFVEKYGFQLNLLSDVGGAVRKQYEVPPSLFGALDGRVTYVVGKDQKIKFIYDNQVRNFTHMFGRGWYVYLAWKLTPHSPAICTYPHNTDTVCARVSRREESVRPLKRGVHRVDFVCTTRVGSG